MRYPEALCLRIEPSGKRTVELEDGNKMQNHRGRAFRSSQVLRQLDPTACA